MASVRLVAGEITEEFLGVTICNVLSSETKRPVLPYHVGFQSAPRRP